MNHVRVTIFFIVLAITVTIFTFAASYLHRQKERSSIQSIKELWGEESNQPKTFEEAQKRAKFRIYRPFYYPPEFSKYGALALFGEDSYVRINYYPNENLAANKQISIQINETKATDDQIKGKLKELLLAEDKNIVELKQVNVCGLVGYSGLAFQNQQTLVFVREKTRILITAFPKPLTDGELLKVACSMQPILVPH